MFSTSQADTFIPSQESCLSVPKSPQLMLLVVDLIKGRGSDGLVLLERSGLSQCFCKFLLAVGVLLVMLKHTVMRAVSSL